VILVGKGEIRMGTIIFIGFLCLIAGGIAWAWENIPALKAALQSGTPAQASEPEAPKKVGYRAGPALFTERMPSIKPDALITIRDPRTGKLAKLQVITYETLQCRVQSGQDWVKSKVKWDAIYCKPEPAYSRSNVLLIHMDKMDYILRRKKMGPEDNAMFQPKSKEFAHRKGGQIAGTVTVDYNGQSMSIQDVGVWGVDDSVDTPHIPAEVIARWMLAHGPDDTAICVEDAQGNNDSIWEGEVVDLNRVVQDVLTEQGE
jgi:hypothetical protein